MRLYLSAASARTRTKSMAGLVCKRRLRMRQWLTLLLDRNCTPGIRWEDKDSAIFRINWKHGSRHGYSPDTDALVFRKWAEYTGKVDSKAAPDPKRWKANFRCALNSLKDVKQVSGSEFNRGVHAFRLYQFVRPRPLLTEKRSHSFRYTRDVTSNDNNLPSFIKVEPEETYGSSYDGSSSRRSLSESSEEGGSDGCGADNRLVGPEVHVGSYSGGTYSATVFIQEMTQLPPFHRWNEPLPGDDLDILNTYQTELVNFNEFNDFEDLADRSVE